MDRTAIKSAIISACRNKLLDSIANLEAAMKDAQQQANDYGPPKDRYDAFRTQLMRRRDMMAQQLDKALNELKTLDKIDPRKGSETANFGSVLLTPEQNYFISIGLGKIETDEMTIFAVSPLVPIAQALTGKKKNDIVQFRELKIKIVELF